MVEIIQRELKKLRENLAKIDAWEKEIEAIKDKMSAYKDRFFSDISSSSTVVTIDDILARDETRLNNLQSNIDYTEYKLKTYKAAILILNDDEKEVIIRRYLDKDNNRKAYREIAYDLKCSHTTIMRWHDSALEKLYNHKQGSIEIA